MGNIRQTQMDSFLELQKTLSEKQKTVYQVLGVHGPKTNRQIAKHLGWI